MITLVKKIMHLIKAYPPIHVARLAYVVTIQPRQMKLVPVVAALYLKIANKRDRVFGTMVCRYLAFRKKTLTHPKEIVLSPNVDEIGLMHKTVENASLGKGIFGEFPIADIDQDGFFLSHVGELESLPQVSESEFAPRKRFRLQLVEIQGRLCIKKCYGKNTASFFRECLALNRAKAAGCNVPSVLNLNVKHLTMLLSYIPGHVLRERLAMEGAILRDRDVVGAPQFTGSSHQKQWEQRIAQGHRVLNRVVDENFVNDVFSQIRKAHKAGVFLRDIKFGNIIIEKNSGAPFLIDFDRSICVRGAGRMIFSHLRDRDLQHANQLFQTQFPTYNSIQQELVERHGQSVYAPAYIGYGLRLGGISKITAGYGRWHYILKKGLPLYQGARILDIGSNNGYNALQMLRHGAKQVIGIEMDPEAIAQGNFLKTAFEWSDNKNYDFKYIQSDMKKIPELTLGNFDMVLALCSLYYLSRDNMAKVASHVADFTDTFVMQANTKTDISRQDPDTYKKASIEYAVKVLKNAGYTSICIIAPPNYSRPIVIGRK